VFVNLAEFADRLAAGVCRLQQALEAEINKQL